MLEPWPPSQGPWHSKGFGKPWWGGQATEPRFHRIFACTLDFVMFFCSEIKWKHSVAWKQDHLSSRFSRMVASAWQCQIPISTAVLLTWGLDESTRGPQWPQCLGYGPVPHSLRGTFAVGVRDGELPTPPATNLHHLCSGAWSRQQRATWLVFQFCFLLFTFSCTVFVFQFCPFTFTFHFSSTLCFFCLQHSLQHCLVLPPWCHLLLRSELRRCQEEAQWNGHFWYDFNPRYNINRGQAALEQSFLGCAWQCFSLAMFFLFCSFK